MADNSAPPSPQAMDTLNNNTGGQTRIWCDGCYDLTHFGHANNLRQAKARCDYLIVGVHSDEEILQHKNCLPVLTSQERYDLVRGIKWVDEVVPAAPYVTSLTTLDKHDAKWCAHGNDITTTADGKDTYQLVKDAGRYLEVDRAQGVSTTDLINRILKCDSQLTPNSTAPTTGQVTSPYTGTQFIASVGRLRQFADAKEPSADARVVYVAGTFDLFHPGHLAFLRKARKLGDYLYVGLYDDATATRISEDGRAPIMNLFERLQNILGFRGVDDVVLGAPVSVSQELLSHLNVAVVCHGVTGGVVEMDPDTNEDPYQVPKDAGIFQEVDSGSRLTTGEMIRRVLKRKEEFQRRNAAKEKKEVERLQAAAEGMQAED